MTLLFFLIPRKIRMYWLLLASYYFYMSWNVRYGLLILFSTGITYLCGLGLDRVKKKRTGNVTRAKKWIVAVSLLLNLGVLFYYKYTNFTILNLNALFAGLSLPVRFQALDILLPVGISFFIFQAIGYTIDVYRDETEAERNFFRYALFVSFFPQLVAGPIERSRNLLSQLKEPPSFDVGHARHGLLIMAYGLFMKMVVADQLAAVVDPVFASAGDSGGMMLLFAVVLFAFQIYCDFNGYTLIAIGSAEVLGFRLNPNFDTPYMGLSVKDFWKRWHISLTSWFRDYLYIPLGGNRKGKLRKQINTLVVFLCSGLWHGAAWHFIVWGGLNGLFSVAEDCLRPGWNRLLDRVGVRRTGFMYRAACRFVTFLLIDFTWLFFRADSIESAFGILRKIAADFRPVWLLRFGFTDAFGSPALLMTVAVSLGIIIAVDILKARGRDLCAAVFRQQALFRWILYAGIVMALLYWGVYGAGYEQTQFIYFQF